MKIEHVKIGMRVRSRRGCYCPIQYTASGDKLRLEVGTVVEILRPNVVAVKFDLHAPIVDMIARELSVVLA